MPLRPTKKLHHPELLLLGLSFTLLFGLHLLRYFPYITDDALISFRYMERFVAGKGLTWTDGYPVEGYSNLLWILLLALFRLFGLGPILASRLLGFGLLITLISTLLRWHATRRNRHSLILAPAVGLFFIVMAGPTAIWMTSGLENPLYAALIGLSIVLTSRLLATDRIRPRDLLPLSFILGLLSVTRPDGPLFSVAVFLTLVLERRFSRKGNLTFLQIVILASGPVLLYGGQLVFRICYYEEVLPNTARVKIAPSAHHLKNGALYTLEGLLSLFPFSLLALAYLGLSLFSPERRNPGLLLALMTLFWSGYLVSIGGDFAPGFRLFTPLIVCFAFGLTDGADWFLMQIDGRRSGIKILAGAGAILAFAGFTVLQFYYPQNRTVKGDTWEWHGKALGQFLKRAFGDEQPLLAVDAAGAVPYWSELPALDMQGLNDYYIARHPPEDFGQGIVAHELGDGDYVLRRRPDIVCFHVGSLLGGRRVWKDFQEGEEFFETYTPVPVVATEPFEHRAYLWMRIDSPKTGIRRTPAEILIPGYFLRAPDIVRSRLNPRGELVFPLPPGQVAGITVEGVRGTDWNVRIEGEGVQYLHTELRAVYDALLLMIRSQGDVQAEIREIVLVRPGHHPPLPG